MFTETNKRNWKLIILAFIIMITFGFLANLKGVIIPEIKKDFAVNYGKIGIMLFIASLGMMLTVFLGGLAADKFGQKTVLTVGVIALLISVGGFYFVNTFIMVVILMFIMSLGFGCLEIGSNSLGALLFTENSAVMMNLLHLFFGVGASIGPKFAGWLLARNIPWEVIYLYSVSLITLVLVLMAASRFPEQEEKNDNEKLPVKTIIKNKKVWMFVGLLGGALIAELGIANWLVNFLQVVRGMNENSSSFYLSLFFITFTGGRLVGGYLAEYLGYLKIIFYFTVIILILLAGGLFLGKEGAILFSFIGFFVSIIFPLTMALMMKEFTTGLSSIMGFVITAGHAVNMTCNWLIGEITDFSGVFIGFSSMLIFTSLIIVSVAFLNNYLTFGEKDSRQEN